MHKVDLYLMSLGKVLSNVHIVSSEAKGSIYIH